VKVAFDRDGWDDYASWATDPKTLRRINRMIEEALRDPGVGIGKPERLAENLSGYWSRRITQEHRLVYRVRDDELLVVQARFHYIQR
jgi:toxin YoeB